MRFVHVAMRTKDLDNAIAFYVQLGMRLAGRKHLRKNRATLAYLEPPEANFQIELVYNWGKDDDYDGGERFGHFALEVDDLDRLYERLLEAGAGDVGRPPALLEAVGPKIAFVADPDGNWIELIQR